MGPRHVSYYLIRALDQMEAAAAKAFAEDRKQIERKKAGPGKERDNGDSARPEVGR